MIEYLLGNYLVKKQKLTETQLQKILYAQHKVRVKLGLIAMSEGLMTKKQTEEVNRTQMIMDKLFGDIAIEKGYLTEVQVNRLLALQGNAYLSFAQALVDEGLLTYEDIQEAMDLFQKEHGFMNTDMEILKSDNVDRIVPLFLPTDDIFYKELAGVAVRMIIRLIDSQVYIGKAYFEEDHVVGNFVSQRIEGERDIATYIAGEGEALLTLACPFAAEIFDTIDEDSVDAVGEFLNTVNGMFATMLSHEDIILELLPPEYGLQETVIEGRTLVLPCYFGSTRTELLIRA